MKNLKDLNINTDWTLFLDRDGVINKQIIDDYVRNWTDFEFLPTTIDALQILEKRFKRIVVVTNQQGIGKGLFTREDLELTHQNMLYELKYYKARIDKCYFAPNLNSENSPNRKPGIGMALQAQKDFPEINFTTSIMIGDSISDMEFAKNAGMTSVFVGSLKKFEENKTKCDFYFANLLEFALDLVNDKN